MEESILVECLRIGGITMIISRSDGRPLEEHLIIITYLYLNARDRAPHRTQTAFLVRMIARYGGKTLGQTITHHHIDTDGMYKCLYFRTYISTRCREDIRFFQAQLLANHAQNGLVDNLIFQLQCQRRALAVCQIFYIPLLSYCQGMVEEFLLDRTCIIHLCLYGDIHLLPETWHTTHTGRMHLSHTLLNFMRISIDDEFGTFAQAEICPSTLKDMGEWKEINDTVLFGNRNALIVCLQSSIILAIGKHHALAISGCSTGIEDISQIIHTCLFVEFLYLRLTRKILSQLQEVLEIESSRIVCTDAHAGIEDDDTFQRWTEGKDTVSLVILLLFANKEKANLRIINHILNLLLAAVGIERHRGNPDTIRTEVGVQIMHTVLREDSDFVKRFSPKIQEGIAHLFHS